MSGENLSVVSVLVFVAWPVAIFYLTRAYFSAKHRRAERDDENIKTMLYSLELENMSVRHVDGRWCVLNEDDSVFYSRRNFKSCVIGAIEKLAK